jgi:multidrug efflux pump subunit AcrA (membrane-fusion protein)
MTRISFKSRWLTHYLLPTIILVSSGVVFYAMGSRPEVPRKPKSAPEATVVEVASAELLDGPLVIETTGEVVPHRVLSVASEVEGRLVWKHPNLLVGERVEAGETLVRIDPKRFALAVERLEIVLEQAANGLERIRQSQANLIEQLALGRKSHEILVGDVQRIRKLQQSRATSVSEVGDVEKLELDARLAIAQLEGQQRSLQIEVTEHELAKRLAAVQLEEARLDQAAAEITAPASGIVIAAPNEEHAMLQAGDSLFTIEESGCLEVHCHLKLDEMAWVWGSQLNEAESKDAAARLAPVSATVVYNAAGRQCSIAGQLVRHHGAGLDPSTRTVGCRVLIEQREIEAISSGQIPLMTGMFVTVHVRCNPHRPLLKIPERGIRTDGSVWLIRNGALASITVQTVQSRDGVVLVDSRSCGIKPADKVIVSPVANARPGLAVRQRSRPSTEATPNSPDRGQSIVAKQAAEPESHVP